MEYVERGGARIPALGLGTWQNTGDACVEAVETALNLGYRHVDTARAYDNEREVGRGVARADVHRDDVFLTTKVWRSDLAADDVRPAVEDSLDALGTDYVDLLLAHWPHPRVPAEETLTAMAELRDDGLVEHVGVSNYTATQLRDAQRAVDVPLVCDQVLYHPYKDQTAVRAACDDLDAALTAYSPLARGSVLDDDLLADVGRRYDKSAAQVALRWLTRQDGVVAVPKATSREHVEANLEALDFELTDEEAARIDDHTGGLGVRLRNRLPALMRRFPL
ncbi:aldo/keto reductase [Halobacterium yunchengense]|uniref:aldo/keto reductase n=1 Tax=Halobacterium yunchengense TaxID=3108497 RepID=UPI00300A65C6